MEPDLRYPVGKFEFVSTLTPDQRLDCIAEIADVPTRLRAAVANHRPAQLDTPYRPGGWTVRQLVHHIGDSHMNAVTRFKLALTEDDPMVKGYDENRLTELADTRTPPVEPSLALLDNLHARWVILLRSLAPEQFPRKFRHAEWGSQTVDFLLAQYAWHGKHHVAHITSLRYRNGWR